MRLAVLLTVAAVLTVPAVAAAHVAPAKGNFEHRLQQRIVHDRGVIRAVDHQAVHEGSWIFLPLELWNIRQWHARDLAIASAALRRIQRPAHYFGWLCIHDGEGSWHNRDTGNNGHYGGLQMHPGWGYGTSYYASDDSPMVQMQAAERGYRASHYSHAWLIGQWGADFPRCSRFF